MRLDTTLFRRDPSRKVPRHGSIATTSINCPVLFFLVVAMTRLVDLNTKQPIDEERMP